MKIHFPFLDSSSAADNPLSWHSSQFHPLLPQRLTENRVRPASTVVSEDARNTALQEQLFHVSLDLQTRRALRLVAI